MRKGQITYRQLLWLLSFSIEYARDMYTLSFRVSLSLCLLAFFSIIIIVILTECVSLHSRARARAYTNESGEAEVYTNEEK